MAQSIARGSFYTKQRISGKNASQSVPAAGLTELFNFVVGDVQRIFAQFVNTGFAFDQFVISCKAHEDAPWSIFYATAGSFTSPAGILVGASGDLTTLASGATAGWFILDVTGLFAIKVEASANGGTTVVDAFLSGNGV